MTLTRVLVAAAIVAAAAACSVTRVSPGLACGSNSDCSGGRTCAQGYCVTDACPGQCQTCDLSVNPPTCDIHDPTGNTTCPTGMACTIHCDSGGPCGNIDCSAAAACTITCSDGGACGNIACGPGACDVTCSANGACGNIACATSCACDVSCASGHCGTIGCPAQPNGSGRFCTGNGSDNQPCDSTVARCGRC